MILPWRQLSVIRTGPCVTVDYVSITTPRDEAKLVIVKEMKIGV